MNKAVRYSIFVGLIIFQLVWVLLLFGTSLFDLLVSKSQANIALFGLLIGFLIVLPLFIAGLFALFTEEDRR